MNNSSGELLNDELDTLSLPSENIRSEIERRQERYIANLQRLEAMDTVEVYPADMVPQRWVELTDVEVREEFYATHKSNLANTFTSKRLPPQLYSIQKNEDTGEQYAVPKFGKYIRSVYLLLDILHAAKKIVPWAKFDSLGIQDDGYTEPFTGNVSRFFPDLNMVLGTYVSYENLINGLGDPKYKKEDREDLIHYHLAVLPHEAVHMHNQQDLDFGGNTRVITETGSMLEEYMAFPGKNPIMDVHFDKALHDFKQGKRQQDYYGEASILGVLLLLKEEKVLSFGDSLDMARQIEDWRSRITSYSEKDLQDYRRFAEEKLILSAQDEKIYSKLNALIYTNAPGVDSLQVVSWMRKNVVL